MKRKFLISVVLASTVVLSGCSITENDGIKSDTNISKMGIEYVAPDPSAEIIQGDFASGKKSDDDILEIAKKAHYPVGWKMGGKTFASYSSGKAVKSTGYVWHEKGNELASAKELIDFLKYNSDIFENLKINNRDVSEESYGTFVDGNFEYNGTKYDFSFNSDRGHSIKFGESAILNMLEIRNSEEAKEAERMIQFDPGVN